MVKADLAKDALHTHARPAGEKEHLAQPPPVIGDGFQRPVHPRLPLRRPGRIKDVELSALGRSIGRRVGVGVMLFPDRPAKVPPLASIRQRVRVLVLGEAHRGPRGVQRRLVGAKDHLRRVLDGQFLAGKVAQHGVVAK